ncbi:hypothetical protein [Kozakia baliensis]|uniref:hypothetical protein n=1 Tax=Kozakia baliensis TaxID=153496 RepID=UPI001C992C5E|nr:hypothetical protein [Kozakia baliensis]
MSADIISRSQCVDGLVVWDMVCGTIGRPCPKVADKDGERLTDIGTFRVPPACIYLFPSNIPSGAVPVASAQPVEAVELLSAFHRCFKGKDSELNHVDFELLQNGSDLMRRTTIWRAGAVQKVSDMTPIRRV